MSLLNGHARCRLLSQVIDRAIAGQRVGLGPLVYMPQHLRVFPGVAEAKVEGLPFVIKRPVSFRIKQCLGERDDPL